MRSFIIKTFSFSVIVLMIVSLFQLIISLRIKGVTVNGHDNLEQTANINAEVVMLGSSRCTDHFDPRFIDAAFHVKSVNIGVTGHGDMVMDILRLKNYLSRNKPPKMVILSFDPLCSVGEADNKNFLIKDMFARYAFLPDEKNRPILNYFKFTKCEEYVPLYAVFKYKKLSDYLLLNNRGPYVKYGYLRSDDKWDTTTLPVTPYLKKFLFNKEQVPEMTKALSSLNTLCKENGIRLICIQTPVYKILRDTAFSYPAQICAGLSIPFVDANLPDIQNDINNFYNSDHLNTTGVHKMNFFLKSNQTLMGLFNLYR